MLRLRSCTAVCALAALLPVSLPSCVTSIRVANNLTRPLYVVAPPQDNSRLFIVEQGGRIKVLNSASGVVTEFLNLSSLIRSSNEQGLLGLAFSPNYQTNGRFYVNYSANADGATQIVEYQVSAGDPNLADPNSARMILRIEQPQANHNGGWMAFGQDGFLYIASGDGGGSNDADAGHTPGTGNAQDVDDNLLGKILRINPAPGADDFPGDPNRNYSIPAGNPFVGTAGDDEIWAYGLRNPWRCSFDRETGDFWIGDVGQGAREEIDFAPASSNGGENYGWRLREGTIATPAEGIGGPPPPGNVEPLYDYVRGTGQFEGRSVTGGYVYRGPVASIRGRYFFGDFANQKVWSITRNGNGFTDLTDWTTTLIPDAGSINSVASFGEDAAGNLYIVDLDGEVFRIAERNPFAAGAQALGRTIGGVFTRRVK